MPPKLGMYRKVYQTRSFNAKDKEKVRYMIWTTEMDRCLTKILVEETKKGNKIDNVLKTAAYVAAVKALNEKFGLDLTKDHIKSRLKTWKKQYGVLKDLLTQRGFKWEKAQKMVVADDSAWNNYIKAHPDARHFRSKVIEHYEELCIILGNNQATTSCSVNGAETEAELMMNNEDMETQTPDMVSQIQSDEKQTRNLRWTEEMDYCLGKILAGQVQKGYNIDNIIQREAYDTTALALNTKFGPDLTKDQITNRLKTWKKQFAVLKELVSHPGFAWDATMKMIVASDSAWKDYIKTHPDAKLFRGSAIEIYDDLWTIFGDYDRLESNSKTDDLFLSLISENEAMETVDISRVQISRARELSEFMIWTREMDSHLSDILARQVKQDKKVDGNLKFVVSSMNTSFQLNLTEDHIMDRLQTWKKQYGVLKEILNQSGFEWDETRQVIVADDSVWNDYIKVNPDARLLQGQVIENYEELSVIVGNYDPSESQSSSRNNGVDLDLTAENEVIETKDALRNRSENAKEKGKYVIWTDEMDHCLTEELIEQVKLGNKLERNFRPAAFNAALMVLNEKFALDLSKENIRNRLKTWKKLYVVLKELLSQGGFGWDEKRKMVVADESVWNEYIKMHPDAKFLRARSIQNYDELSIIFGNDQPSGYRSKTGTKVDENPTFNNEEYHVITPLPMTMVDEETSQDNTENGTQGSSQQTRARAPSSSQSKQPSKKRRYGDVMIEMMSAMAANIGRIADALAEATKTVCLEEVFEMVQDILGFDDDLIIDACEYLSFDEKRARMFLKLDERLRKLWLFKRLRGQHS